MTFGIYILTCIAALASHRMNPNIIISPEAILCSRLSEDVQAMVEELTLIGGELRNHPRKRTKQGRAGRNW
jgi:hypothetical protein